MILQLINEPNNKFKTLEEWFKGYVDPTIKNIYKILKPNCYYAVNIADFNINSKHKIELVDRWIEISKENGFEYIKQIHMKLQQRRGDGHSENKRNKKEGIFIFKKINK